MERKFTSDIFQIECNNYYSDLENQIIQTGQSCKLIGEVDKTFPSNPFFNKDETYISFKVRDGNSSTLYQCLLYLRISTKSDYHSLWSTSGLSGKAYGQFTRYIYFSIKSLKYVSLESTYCQQQIRGITLLTWCILFLVAWIFKKKRDAFLSNSAVVFYLSCETSCIQFNLLQAQINTFFLIWRRGLTK